MGVNNAAKLFVVVQGLRGDLVAQKGQKVARVALGKSVAYVSFFDEVLEISRQMATVLDLGGFRPYLRESRNMPRIIASNTSKLLI